MLPFSRFLALLGAASSTVTEIADTAGTSAAQPEIAIRGAMMLFASPSVLDLDAVISRLRDTVDSFLYPWEEDQNEEFEYIRDSTFSQLVDRFAEILPKYVRENSPPLAFRQIYQRMRHVLERMNEVNGTIRYQEARMKHSVIDEQKELKDLAKRFVKLHDRLSE
jgi:hypothetical protein